MKANLNTFGANQYKLPEQEGELKLYFSVQSFFLELGNVLGMFLVPILRESVKCFGSDDCYSLAFGVSGLMMIAAFLFFLCGRSTT
jgi:solute carrier family 15 (oligopeptide transporter), member 1